MSLAWEWKSGRLGMRAVGATQQRSGECFLMCSVLIEVCGLL